MTELGDKAARQQTALSIPLRIERPIGSGAAIQPVTFGVPLPAGLLAEDM